MKFAVATSKETINSADLSDDVDRSRHLARVINRLRPEGSSKYRVYTVREDNGVYISTEVG